MLFRSLLLSLGVCLSVAGIARADDCSDALMAESCAVRTVVASASRSSTGGAPLHKPKAQATKTAKATVAPSDKRLHK